MNTFFAVILDSDLNNKDEWVYVLRSPNNDIYDCAQYSPKDIGSVSKLEYMETFYKKIKVKSIHNTCASGNLYHFQKI